MNNSELSTVVENLAVEIVMLEHNDHEEFNQISEMFIKIKKWAEENSQPKLETIVEKCHLALQNIQLQSIPDPEFIFSLINKTISEIQHHSRNKYNFASASFPDELNHIKNPVQPNDNDHNSDKNKSDDDQLPSSPNYGLIHPDKLPSYLGYDLFAEFLALQIELLDKMETLILSIEQQNDEASITELKRLLHTTKGEAGFLNLLEVEQLCHTVEDLLGVQSPSKHTDLFFEALDWLRKTFTWYMGKGDQQDSSSEIKKKFTFAITNNELSIKSLDIQTVSKCDITPDSNQQPYNEKNSIPKLSRETAKIRETITVDAERLDKLIDMIGELVVAESMMIESEEIKKIETQTLSRHLSQMNKITRGLQETGLSLRMLPIKATFQKMARVARDTAKKSGKNVNFIMYGEETELDKSVIDKIGDPLLHMVRNAVDHGIEKTCDERCKISKSETATVTLRAFHKGGNIQIEVEDDGKGLNTQGIKQKAIMQNLIHENSILSDHEIHNLIFQPGFTTAPNITDISGRGVGLNVVKSNIEELHGQIEIKTEIDKGTVFIIKIPLTLAIIDGMVVTANNERYIIPTLSIITSCKLHKQKCTFVFGKGKMIDIQGGLVPLFSMSSLFDKNIETEIPENALLVIVEEDQKRAAIIVDDLLGKQQIVIKSLGETMKKISGIAGGAIMPDGKVGLIIDVAHLIFSANKNQP